MKSIRKIVDVLAVACMVFVLASCGGSKADKIVKQINEATEKVGEAKTMEELQTIQNGLLPVLSDMIKEAAENPDEFSEEDKVNLQKAGNDFDAAYTQKAMELQGAMMSAPESFTETEIVTDTIAVVPDTI